MNKSFQSVLVLSLFLSLFCFAEVPLSADAADPEAAKIQKILKEFKEKSTDAPIADVPKIKKLVQEQEKSTQTAIAKLFGTTEQLKQALTTFTTAKPGKEKTEAAYLLTLNHIRFSNPNLNDLKDGLPKQTEFSEAERKVMEEASKGAMQMADLMKKFAAEATPEQIRYISQDNPNPVIPRLLLWPFGPQKQCTKKMAQQIHADLGARNFQRLSPILLTTTSSYESLYEQAYLKRTIEILSKDTSKNAKLLLAHLGTGPSDDRVKEVMEGFMKMIDEGEGQFVQNYGPSVTKEDARIFFQGFARKYPYCLGLFSLEFDKLKKDLK